jgi:hypothetical protein
MNRRTFIMDALAFLAAPLAVEAQQAGEEGLARWLSRPRRPVAPMMDSLYSGLREQGYVIGRDIVIEELSASRSRRHYCCGRTT